MKSKMYAVKNQKGTANGLCDNDRAGILSAREI